MIHSFLLGFYKKESIDGYYWDDPGEVNQFQSWEESGVMKPDSWLPTESFYDVEYKWGLWG